MKWKIICAVPPKVAWSADASGIVLCISCGWTTQWFTYLPQADNGCSQHVSVHTHTCTHMLLQGFLYNTYIHSTDPGLPSYCPKGTTKGTVPAMWPTKITGSDMVVLPLTMAILTTEWPQMFVGLKLVIDIISLLLFGRLSSASM